MRYIFGIVQLSGKPGEKRKYCEVSVKEPEAQRQQRSVCFFFCYDWGRMLKIHEDSIPRR